MALVTCSKRAVLQGRISLPISGPWTASLQLDAEEAPSGTTTIAAADGLSLEGTIRLARVDARNRAHTSVIGGKGKLLADVAGYFRSAQLRDPLNAAARASGDALSSKISSALLNQSLAFWTQGPQSVALELYALARAAGADVNWRYEPGGSLWMGAETWPAAKLGSDEVIVSEDADKGLTVVAVTTLRLQPGVDIEGIGKIRCVDYWLHPDRVRAFLWT